MGIPRSLDKMDTTSQNSQFNDVFSLQNIDHRNINKTFLGWVGINGNLLITKYVYYLGHDTERILRLACSTATSSIVQWLMTSGCPLPSDIMHYPCQNGNEALFHILAKNGGNLNFTGNAGNASGESGESAGSPLFKAIVNKHTNLIYQLHNYGANMTLKYNGWNALHYACIDNNYQAVKALLSLSSSTNVLNVKDDYGNFPMDYTKDPNIRSMLVCL